MHLIEVWVAFLKYPNLSEQAHFNQVKLEALKDRDKYNNSAIFNIVFDLNLQVRQVKLHVPSVLDYDVHF